MDELMLELELLRQLEDDEVEVEEKKENASPYQNAKQEAMGQFASMFQNLDEILQSLEEEENTKRSV